MGYFFSAVGRLVIGQISFSTTFFCGLINISVGVAAMPYFEKTVLPPEDPLTTAYLIPAWVALVFTVASLPSAQIVITIRFFAFEP